MQQERRIEDAMKHGMYTFLFNRLPEQGPQLSALAKRALLKGKVTVSIMKQDPNLCMKNDVLGLWDPTLPFFRENSLSLLSSILRSRGQTLEEDNTRTALFLSFIKNPENWIDPEATDLCFDQDTDPFKISLEKQDELDRFMQGCMRAAFLDYKKCNTRQVEQDTDYHRLEGGNASALIIGDVNVVANTMAPMNLTYAEACDRTLKSIFGVSPDSDLDGKHFRRSNDFPVLVGLDTVRYAKQGDRVHLVDFYQRTSTTGQPLVPLLLTSATEVVLRIQLQYLGLLYGMGCVSLDPQPVESNKKVTLYRLDDGDTNSLVMNLVRSDSFLYSVCVQCPVCCKTFNHYWTPGVDAGQDWELPGCDSCGCERLENLSAFVMRDAPSRQSLDPASVRHIQWEVPSERKVPLLPENVSTKGDLAHFEHVNPEGSIASLKVHLSGDYPRKNQRTSTVAVTLYVPVAFDLASTVDSMKGALGENASIVADNPHLVRAYTFLGDKEHELTLTVTRVKLTLTCNRRSVPAPVPRELLNETKWDLFRLKKTVHLESDADCVKVSMDVPAVQTNKRIGVQTVLPDGQPMEHSSKVLLSPATRVDSRRQKQSRQEEDGTMYSALNFWCHPDWQERNNFMRFGSSLVAGLVYNMYAQGTLHLSDGTTCNLLPLGAYNWNDLDELEGVMSPKVAQYLYGMKKIADVKEAIQEKETIIREQRRQITSYQNSKDVAYVRQLEDKLKASEEALAQMTMEKERLEKENANLKREIRQMMRTIAKHEKTMEENKAHIKKQDERLNKMEEQILQLMGAKQEPKPEPEIPTELYPTLNLGDDTKDMFQALLGDLEGADWSFPDALAVC